MTVTSRAVAAAPPETLMLTVRVFELVRVTEFTVMPVPENATEPPNGPLAPPKFEPLNVMLWFD